MNLGRTCSGPTRLLLLGGHFPLFGEALSYLRGALVQEGVLLPHTLPSPGFTSTPLNRFDRKAGVVSERGKGRSHWSKNACEISLCNYILQVLRQCQRRVETINIGSSTLLEIFLPLGAATL